MNITVLVVSSVALSILVIGAQSGCESEQPDPQARWTDTAAPASAPVAPRWYTLEQVEAGAALYAQNCASCHKPNAEGASDWKTRDANGKLPPPPLNGTAHAWHHSLDLLRTVVKRGGAPVGGSMPPFAGKLAPQEIDAILAWVQSHWSDEIYAIWHERDRASGGGMQAIR
ncbi:MAG: cytochrome c [Chromatiaceae bacterium]|nr:cytochrome c [Chromatiaceae bacterium]MCP5306995.1 cytochrome c [Chromatiaceae bacterium]MCP5423377.1 cytochrome c [Chromatiaceae bacterium]